jgi:hypothetical protein
MEAKIAKRIKIAKLLEAGRTAEVSLADQTKEVVIGGSALTKSEALEIFYGKAKAAAEAKAAAGRDAASLDPRDPNFNPDVMPDDGYRGPRGPQASQAAKAVSPAGAVQPVEKTVEMYKGIQKTVINVK